MADLNELRKTIEQNFGFLKKFDLAQIKDILMVILITIAIFVQVERYLSDYELNKAAEARRGGYYSVDKQFILIKTENISFSELERRFKHEAGHYIFSSVLNNSQRKTYCEWYDGPVAGYPDALSCTENFARDCEVSSPDACFDFWSSRLERIEQENIFDCVCSVSADGGGGGCGCHYPRKMLAKILNRTVVRN